MSVSLVSGWVPVVVPVATGIAVLLGVDWRTRRGLTSFGCAVASAALLAGGTWWVQLRWRPIPYDVAAPTYLWLGLLALAVCVPVSAMLGRRSAQGPAEPARRSPRAVRRVWRRITVAALAVPLAMASLAVAVNARYGYYPTFGSLRGDSGSPRSRWLRSTRRGTTTDTTTGDPPTTEVSAVPRTAAVAPPAWARRAGGPRRVGRRIGEPGPARHPGPGLGVQARAAWVWAPPLYTAGVVAQPPVVMLLAGSPGQTSDWLRGGNAAATAQKYADAHHGVAPLLVLPDPNGSLTADTECVDSRRGRAETYLTRDVPTFLAAHFGVAMNRWAVVGLSEGGTCAAMLALRHPDQFASFADFSGLTSPTLTETVDRTATARDLFNGDVLAYDEHDPLWLLTHNPPRSVFGYWQTGADDRRCRTAQRTLASLATSAGLQIQAVETPNQRHDFTFWTAAFAAALPNLLAATAGTTPPGR